MTPAPDARMAVYYAPAPDDPLWTAGCAWLGRDAMSGLAVPQPAVPDIAAVTRAPRLYGFHATLKAPFRLRPGVTWDEVVSAGRAICAEIAPFPLPSLRVDDLEGYLALLATETTALQALADRVVAGFDRLRAAANAAELARRRAAGLNERREAMLVRWGYPDVFAEWRFHMTLSERLSPSRATVLRPAAEAFFAKACAVERQVGAVSLFMQEATGAPFLLKERIALEPVSQTRRTPAETQTLL